MSEHMDRAGTGFIRAMARELLVRHAASMTVEEALCLSTELLQKSSNPIPSTHTRGVDHVCNSH
jgi:hypothetical protein